MMTALKSASFDNLQLDAGLFLIDFDYSSYTTKSALATAVVAAIGTNKCLGATRGGGNFTATPNTHSVEADGKRYEFVGSTRIDSWDIKMTGTLLETTYENFKTILGTADSTTASGVTKIKLRTELQDDDYISNLVWVGDLSNGGYVLISLKNVLNTTGMNFTFADKGESTIPFEFHAHQATVEDNTYAPCEVVFFEA